MQILYKYDLHTSKKSLSYSEDSGVALSKQLKQMHAVLTRNYYY